VKNKVNLKKIKSWVSDSSIDECDSPGIHPAKNFIPDWYKDMPRFNDNSKKIKIYDNGSSNVGLKFCIPFLDSINIGYMVTLHCDILVEGIGKDKRVSWTSGTSPIDGRPIETVGSIPSPPGYGNFTQAWKFRHGLLLPKGYSLLFTQPLNHTELNTYTTSGVVDADGGMSSGGIPFAIREDFEGIIKKGTPIVQIIPFKRDNWILEKLSKKPKSFILWSPRNSIYGWYKQNIWKKKSFQ
jgi:hypothetical protein